MYYANSGASNQENATGTWEDDFRGVWHLNEESTGTRYDSTTNGHNTTATNYDGDEAVTGKIGGADNFDGSSDILVGPSSNSITGDNLQVTTMSAWVKHSHAGDNGYITALKRLSTNSTLFSLDPGSTAGSLGFLTRNYANTTHPWLSYNGGYNDGEWHHLVAVINNLDRILYVDGSQRNSDVHGLQSVTGNTALFTIGGFAVGSILFNGTIDEVQISNTNRSADWVKASYENQNSPSAFYSLGSEQSIPSMQQIHYHWRNDDDSESSATSATGGSEDASLTLDVSTRKRLRIEISNNMSTSISCQYRLEYGEKVTNCAGISSWTDVGTGGGDWDMSSSSYLTDNNDTTNIATSTGGVTDENTNFKTSNAAVKDTSSQTNSISLTTAEFVEIEYSIIALSSAKGKNYCFRLTNAGSITNFLYNVYPEVIIPKLEQIHYRWRNDDGPEATAEAWYNSSWLHRKKITATSSSSAIPSTQTNFPMLISITDTDLRDDAQGVLCKFWGL